MTSLFIPDFVTESEATELRRLHHFNHDPATSVWRDKDLGGVVIPKAVREGILNHSVVQRAYQFVKENYSPKVSLSPPSYVTTEDMTSGHPLHDDRGISYGSNSTGGGHMMWCKHTVSVLLSPASGFTGGEFYYESASAHQVSPTEQYLGLSYYSSDERHWVTSHKGERVMLLLFMGEDA